MKKVGKEEKKHSLEDIIEIPLELRWFIKKLFDEIYEQLRLEEFEDLYEDQKRDLDEKLAEYERELKDKDFIQD